MINIFLILIGAAFVIESIYSIFRSDRIRENGIKVPGLVVDMEVDADTGRNRDRGVIYRPVIEFETKEGRKLVKAYSVGTNPAMFRKGERVDVLYHKDDPEEFELANKPFLTTGVPFMLMLIGCAFIVIGVWLLVG